MEEQRTKLTTRGPEPLTTMTVLQEIKATSHRVDADGTARTREWTMVHDGRNRPVTGDPDVDTLALTRVDRYTAEFTERRAGGVVITGTQAISRDGKVMTVTSSGSNAKGQRIHDVAVFEKQ